MSDAFIPDWAVPFKVGEFTIGVDGNVYAVHVLSNELEPNRPHFLGFSDGKFLFISEDVPEEFRIHVLSHEVREFAKKGEKGACKRALLNELEHLAPEMRKRYLAYRTRFFERLVAFYHEQSGDKIDHLKAEIAESLAHLKLIE